VVITAQGVCGDFPPADEAGFRDFLGSFGRTEFSDLLANSQIVKPLVAWRNTANRLRDYANLPTRPDGFVVLGDAVAAFNPIYGQGMSVAAMGAQLLGDQLRQWREDHDDEGAGLPGFAQHFQQALDAQLIQGCWAFSAGSDLNIPGVRVNGDEQEVGPSPETMYAQRVVALATEDDDIARRLMETIQMTRGPEWMGEPELRVRIMDDWDRLGSLTRVDAVAVGP